jgi:hypothetical protein
MPRGQYKRKPGKHCCLNVRVTDAQKTAFFALGGNAWLRGLLDASPAVLRTVPTPHCPFPTAEPRGPRGGKIR